MRRDVRASSGSTYIVTMVQEKFRGPRGGETTVTKSGMVRKTIWLHGEEAEVLRNQAFKDRRTESEIIREALRAFLKIPD
jgi:hypothetical protein